MDISREGVEGLKNARAPLQYLGRSEDTVR